MANVKVLEDACGITRASRVLDIGCGQGRLLNGLVEVFGSVQKYVGVDVHAPSIAWLQENIAPVAPFAEFHLSAFRNERYNRSGADSFDLQVSGEFDCITLLSVFSHMWLRDIQVYLQFIRRHSADGGKVYLTLFVEDDVEAETENPVGYYREWKGPLHCIRLNRQSFERLVAAADLQVERFRYRHTADGQSSYVLGPKSQRFTAAVIEQEEAKLASGVNREPQR
ncbi:MAG: class I SAM-dependent methyltransferase [Hyphomicrobiaceae bacterium]